MNNIFLLTGKRQCFFSEKRSIYNVENFSGNDYFSPQQERMHQKNTNEIAFDDPEDLEKPKGVEDFNNGELADRFQEMRAEQEQANKNKERVEEELEAMHIREQGAKEKLLAYKGEKGENISPQKESDIPPVKTEKEEQQNSDTSNTEKNVAQTRRIRVGVRQEYLPGGQTANPLNTDTRSDEYVERIYASEKKTTEGNSYISKEGLSEENNTRIT